MAEVFDYQPSYGDRSPAESHWECDYSDAMQEDYDRYLETQDREAEEELQREIDEIQREEDYYQSQYDQYDNNDYSGP